MEIRNKRSLKSDNESSAYVIINSPQPNVSMTIFYFIRCEKASP